jgi:hypothetical protein
LGWAKSKSLSCHWGASQHPLAELSGLVPVKFGDERQRQGERPQASRLLVDEHGIPEHRQFNSDICANRRRRVWLTPNLRSRRPKPTRSIARAACRVHADQF